MTKVSWSQIKPIINLNKGSYIWVQDDNSYTITAYNGLSELQAIILATNPPSQDQTDFENNYKSGSNSNIKLSVIQQLGIDSVAICPFGTLFTAPAGETTTYDLAIENTVYLKGGVMYSAPGNVGDTITVQIVDKNGITGLPAGTVLATYVDNWYVIPEDSNAIEDVSLSAPMPAGLYVRFIYTNTSETDTKVIVNLLAYQGVV